MRLGGVLNPEFTGALWYWVDCVYVISVCCVAGEAAPVQICKVQIIVFFIAAFLANPHVPMLASVAHVDLAICNLWSGYVR